MSFDVRLVETKPAELLVMRCANDWYIFGSIITQLWQVHAISLSPINYVRSFLLTPTVSLLLAKKGSNIYCNAIPTIDSGMNIH